MANIKEIQDENEKYSGYIKITNAMYMISTSKTQKDKEKCLQIQSRISLLYSQR